MLKVLVVSDATGETAERVVRAALVQFEDAKVVLVRRGKTRSPEQVRAVVAEAAGQDAFIIHSLVSDGLRRVMLEEARLRGVDALDMLGPVLERLAKHLKLSPQERPGLFRQIADARSREIEAVDFAFRHDDGQNPDDLAQAEVVLVGISRSMKTPTMLYLAYRGWFAANVPLVPELEPPPALVAYAPDRVFCLHLASERLRELRRVRAKSDRLPLERYASIEQIEKEEHYAREACLRFGWRSIDATGKSVEEIAREIISLLPERETPPAGTGDNAGSP